MNPNDLKLALEKYLSFLQLQEYTPNTLRCYRQDISGLISFMTTNNHTVLVKEVIIAYKKHLQQRLKPVSINRGLNTINAFLRYLNLHHLVIKALKVQSSNVDDNALSMVDLKTMVNHAYSINKSRIAKIMLTLAGTGIRIGELKNITAESLIVGYALVNNKGKFRYILLPDDIREMLKVHCQEAKLTEGPVFINNQGKPLSRSYIAEQMKQIAKQSGVDTCKVFPHNFRHLFARSFLDKGYPVTDLADHLGHSSINTTRRYLLTSTTFKQTQLSNMKMSLGTPFHVPHIE